MIPSVASAAQRSINGHLRAGLTATGCLVGLVGGWAGTTELSGAVMAPAVVVVDSNVKKVQHPTGGIVGEIAVREGDRVKSGDLVMRLDETLTSAKLANVDEEIRGLTAQEQAKRREIDIIRRELDGVRELWQKNLVSITRLTSLEREAARLEGEHGHTVAAIAQARSNKIAAEDQLRRVDLRAPRDGVIHQLAVHTVGGVIAAGETVAQIVPEMDALMVEASISPQDIDQITVGQPALMRFSAFNQRTTPEIRGSINRISADLTTDQRTGVGHYTVRIVMPEEETARLGAVRLLPGMPVEAFIQTSDRTVLSYFLKPLADQFAKAFREE